MTKTARVYKCSIYIIPAPESIKTNNHILQLYYSYSILSLCVKHSDILIFYMTFFLCYTNNNFMLNCLYFLLNLMLFQPDVFQNRHGRDICIIGRYNDKKNSAR